MITIYHKPDFNLIPIDIWSEIEFFLSVHPTHILKRVCVCDKYLKCGKINEEKLVSEFLWVLFYKEDNPVMTYDFYFQNHWVCLQFELDIMKYIYSFEEEEINEN